MTAASSLWLPAAAADQNRVARIRATANQSVRPSAGARMAGRRTRWRSYSGRLKATYSPPEGPPVRPPPAAITTYCLPSTL